MAMSLRLLSGALALVVGLVVLVSPAASSDRAKGVVGECPAGSVLALILPRRYYVCLRQGQACKFAPSVYRAYGFRCKRGRLARLPKWKGFTSIVDVGGYRPGDVLQREGRSHGRDGKRVWLGRKRARLGWLGLFACPARG
jgi:hypothetical protein